MQKIEVLRKILKQREKCAIAFSGGTDSAFLLSQAVQHCQEVVALCARTPFQPEFERRDAQDLADFLHCRIHFVEIDLLSEPSIRSNSKERCYFCKKKMFHALLQTSKELGFGCLLDGTNASDDPKDRPGMRALEELHIESPLRNAGWTKMEIRAESQRMHLPCAQKFAYACLATRVMQDEVITVEKLQAIEQCERYLHNLNCIDVRVRVDHRRARIEVPAENFATIVSHRLDILDHFSPHFDTVSLDLKAR